MESAVFWLGLVAIQTLVTASAIGWGVTTRTRRRREQRVANLLGQVLSAVDPGAKVERGDHGRLRAAVSVRAQACEVVVDPHGATGVECALRTTVPAAAMAALLKAGGDGGRNRVATGDSGFDDLFAVDTRAPGALRLLSGRVRLALVSLPRGMDAPRLAIECGTIELSWRGEPSREAVREACAVIDAVQTEFNDLLPLR